MQICRREAQAHQRLRPELRRLGLAEADVREGGPHVVQQKIGEGRHDLEAQGANRICTGHECRHVAGRTPDFPEHQGALRAQDPERCTRWRREEADERIGGVELLGGDLRFGKRIDAGGEGKAGDDLLRLIAGIGDAHLHDERPPIELAQRRRLCLAAEPPEAAVRRPVGTAGNAVAVEVERVCARQNLRVGHRVEQAESEQIGCRAMAGVGGRRGDRLRSHLQEIAVGGCDLFLNDLPADRGEIVAASPGAVKRRRV